MKKIITLLLLICIFFLYKCNNYSNSDKLFDMVAFQENSNIAEVILPDKKYGYYLSTVLWPSEPLTGQVNINICWENPTTNDVNERGWVKDAIETSWGTSNSRIHFANWNACTGGENIHILISDNQCPVPGCTAPIGNPHTHGLGTTINYMQNGMLLNFTFQNWGCSGPCNLSQTTRKNWIKWISVHEFGHALAIAHEQNRPDTPNTCSQSQGTSGNTTVGSWDANSVMNYCNIFWNNNGVLSAGDIQTINVMYPQHLFRTPCEMPRLGLTCCNSK